MDTSDASQEQATGRQRCDELAMQLARQFHGSLSSTVRDCMVLTGILCEIDGLEYASDTVKSLAMQGYDEATLLAMYTLLLHRFRELQNEVERLRLKPEE